MYVFCLVVCFILLSKKYLLSKNLCLTALWNWPPIGSLICLNHRLVDVYKSFPLFHTWLVDVYKSFPLFHTWLVDVYKSFPLFHTWLVDVYKSFPLFHTWLVDVYKSFPLFHTWLVDVYKSFPLFHTWLVDVYKSFPLFHTWLVDVYKSFLLFHTRWQILMNVRRITANVNTCAPTRWVATPAPVEMGSLYMRTATTARNVSPQKQPSAEDDQSTLIETLSQRCIAHVLPAISGNYFVYIGTLIISFSQNSCQKLGLTVKKLPN